MPGDTGEHATKIISRRWRGAKFTYFSPSGKRITDRAEIERINKLRIPPAWKDVRIAKTAKSRIQATGLDIRGRKQYIYSLTWREKRSREKYKHVIDFVCALPKIRRRVKSDLRRPGLPKEKVLALVVHLLETTLIRVGNEEYRKQNKSYGLTTLRDHHVRIRGGTVCFEFIGKSKKKHHIELHSRRLAALVKKCRDVPGEVLFQYRTPEGGHAAVSSTDINAYLKEITGEALSAKDFRTWAATLHTASELHALSGESSAELKRNVRRAIQNVAERLGNTPAICKTSYIHPSIIERYLEGSFLSLYSGRKLERGTGRLRGLRIEEIRVFTFLQNC